MIQNDYVTGRMIDSIDSKKPAFEPLTAFRVKVDSRHAGLVILRTTEPSMNFKLLYWCNVCACNP